MARICEKNRCPTGIATHDPKFKAKYKGTPEHVVQVLQLLAEQARAELARLGVRRLAEVVGQRRFLRAHPDHAGLVEERGIDLSPLLQPVAYDRTPAPPPTATHDRLNRRIIDDVLPRLDAGQSVTADYTISNEDRAAVAGLAGLLAERSHRARMRDLDGQTPNFRDYYPAPGRVQLRFAGSAGQGFCAFLVGGIDVQLRGEANDSVAKSMCGGKVVVRPPAQARFSPHDNAILGNGALYGATGGTLFVHGRAGDRFAVRNSGAKAVVEGAGLHACEYMTGGEVVILGSISANAGAGMTGGTLWLPREMAGQLHPEYVMAVEPDDLQLARLRRLLVEYVEATHSATARALLAEPGARARWFVRVVSIRDAARRVAPERVATEA
jgi:glutamate synthase (ferredoxin)